MPTYQYACTECGHDFEQFQSFSDDALTVCPACEGRLRKVFNAVGVVFKGSGFYRTDSRSDAKAAAGATSASSESGKSDSSAGSGDGSKDSGGSSTKTEKSGSGDSGSKSGSTDSGSKSSAGSGTKSAGTSPAA